MSSCPLPAPVFRRALPSGRFAFREAKRWHYRDAKVNTVDTVFVPLWDFNPHLLLAGPTGPARFALGWERLRDGYGLLISQIQRLRTAYEWRHGRITSGPGEGSMGYGWKWIAQLETKEQNRLRRNLGGIHPMDFLLFEFLHRHRNEGPVRLHYFSDEAGGRNYRWLIEHYCVSDNPTRHPTAKGIGISYTLDLENPVIQAALRLEETPPRAAHGDAEDSPPDGPHTGTTAF